MNEAVSSIQDMDARVFRKIVESRRSIRRFKDEPIPDMILDDCLDMALLAPNSSNLQPWDFYVVKSPELKPELAKACLSQNAARTAPVLIVATARTKTWRNHSKQILKEWPDAKMPKIVENYYAKLVPFFYGQGPFGLWGRAKKVFSVVSGFTRPVPRGPFSENDMKVWAVKSTALAAENLMLALRANGYDSCPMEGFDEKRVKKLLDIPRDGVVAMVIAAGARDAKGLYQSRYRLNRNQVVHYR